MASLPAFIALPIHTPLASWVSGPTLEYPAPSIALFAWALVKELAPAVGPGSTAAGVVLIASLRGVSEAATIGPLVLSASPAF